MTTQKPISLFKKQHGTKNPLQLGWWMMIESQKKDMDELFLACSCYSHSYWQCLLIVVWLAFSIVQNDMDGEKNDIAGLTCLGSIDWRI
jgi:hypothetical protein